MQVRHLFAVAVLLISVGATKAQPRTESEATKIKEDRRVALALKIAEDAQYLRLPENRATVAARVGVWIWKTDPERGRKLFETAVADLIAAQEEAESAKGKAHLYHDLLNSSNIRPQILLSIASIYPDYALESFHRTRPAAVARAMSAEVVEKLTDQAANRSNLVQSEMNLEQKLVRMVADNSPEKAAALLKESIRKKLSNETYESLKKLYLMDASAGLELAENVLGRLNSAAFIANEQPVWDLLQLSNSIITDHIRERPVNEKYLAFSDSSIRTLSIKVLNTYVDHAARIGYIPLEQLESVAKRYSPGHVERLRKAAQSTRSGWNSHRGVPGNADYEAFIKTNPSADQMVQNAAKFPVEIQRQMFQNAANKFSETGQYQNAVALLNERFEGEALDHAVSSLNWYYAHHLMQKGDHDAAEAVMMEFNESNRISALTSLAQNLYAKNPAENRTRAAGILRRVRSLMPDRPENYNELHQLFTVITAMTPVEPADAFSNLEPLVNHINQLLQAFAVVQGFQGAQMRNGEYYIYGGTNFGIQVEPGMLHGMAMADFDRTNGLIDALSRPELRISLRLYIAQNL